MPKNILVTVVLEYSLGKLILGLDEPGFVLTDKLPKVNPVPIIIDLISSEESKQEKSYIKD